MLGAVAGDIIGSVYEHHNLKSKDFPLFGHHCHPTDDSMMTLAVAEALFLSGGDPELLKELAVGSMQRWGRMYPNAGYGGSFRRWLQEDDPQPYGSWANGSAMRVSPCGWMAATEEEALRFARIVSEVTHDHPDGIKGGEAVALAVYLAKEGRTKQEIKERLSNFYSFDFSLDEIRAEYSFDVSCSGSVPQAIEAFFESSDYEDAVRNAVSIGGDSDTIAAIAGGIAEACYGIPEWIRTEALARLYPAQRALVAAVEAKFPPKILL